MDYTGISKETLDVWGRFWQDLLRLNDWRIDFLWTPSHEAEGVAGRCHYWEEEMYAKVYIVDPETLQPQMVPRTLETILVHELLHIHFDRVTDPMAALERILGMPLWSVTWRNVEQGVEIIQNILAKILVDLRIQANLWPTAPEESERRLIRMSEPDFKSQIVDVLKRIGQDAVVTISVRLDSTSFDPGPGYPSQILGFREFLSNNTEVVYRRIQEKLFRVLATLELHRFGKIGAPKEADPPSSPTEDTGN